MKLEIPLWRLGDDECNCEAEALGLAIIEAERRGIDVREPFTVVWDRPGRVLEVSQDD